MREIAPAVVYGLISVFYSDVVHHAEQLVIYPPELLYGVFNLGLV